MAYTWQVEQWGHQLASLSKHYHVIQSSHEFPNEKTTKISNLDPFQHQLKRQSQVISNALELEREQWNTKSGTRNRLMHLKLDAMKLKLGCITLSMDNKKQLKRRDSKLMQESTFEPSMESSKLQTSECSIQTDELLIPTNTVIKEPAGEEDLRKEWQYVKQDLVQQLGHMVQESHKASREHVSHW